MIVLATNSQRRIKMFRELKWDFIVADHQFDESSVNTNIEPSKYCIEIAKGKSKSISKDHLKKFIIGSDTIVFFEKKIIGKPTNKIEAKKILERLSGNIHDVFTGVSVINLEKNININFYCRTEVQFWKLRSKMINNYLNQKTFSDKAGGYSIQGSSKLFIKSINGCHENVLGFPISLFYEKINTIGINLI